MTPQGEKSAVLQIPSVLRPLTEGAAVVEVPAGTLREALDDLQARHPALARAVRTENGTIRPHVNLFVHNEDIRHQNGLETVVRPGDMIIILPSISGG